MALSRPPIAFHGDWRRPYMDKIKRDFPRLDEGGIRDTLARALGRAVNVGAAAIEVSDAAKELKLNVEQRHSVTLLVCALENQAARESEV